MAKRKITPERRERRKQLAEFLQRVGITDVTGVQELFKEMVGSVLGNGLDGELEEEFSCSKYDCCNNKTGNSCNGYAGKTLKSSLGEIRFLVPVTVTANSTLSW